MPLKFQLVSFFQKMGLIGLPQDKKLVEAKQTVQFVNHPLNNGVPVFQGQQNVLIIPKLTRNIVATCQAHVEYHMNRVPVRVGQGVALTNKDRPALLDQQVAWSGVRGCLGRVGVGLFEVASGQGYPVSPIWNYN